MGRYSNEKRSQMASEAAAKASEAGRTLQAQRQPESENVDPQQTDHRPEGDTPPPRNEPRRLAMEEIEKRQMRTDGIEPELVVEPPEPTPKEAATPEPALKTELAPEQVVEPALEPKTVKVKVDGEEFEVPQADIDEAGGVRAYQKERAADNRLKKASDLVTQTRQAQAGLVQWVQQQIPKQPTQTPDEFLLSKIDEISFGAPEQRAAALREAIERINPRVDQQAITQQAVNQMQRSLAVGEFQREFSDVVNQPLALKLAMTLETERVGQMQKEGHTPNWPSVYRQIGNEVRSVIGRPSQPAATEQTTSTPSQVSEKEARKASIVNLPTAAARAALPAESKPETREDTLNDMRKSRGIPTG